jgi:arabinosaccharide transport system substrate-binding protein
MKKSVKIVILALLTGVITAAGVMANGAKEGGGDGKLVMWTFVDLHARFYEAMMNQWNREHPDRQIKITFTNMPYGEMHNKVTMAIQTGKGAPDLCDIEISQFPNYLKGKVAFLPLNEYVAPYEKDIVKSRLDIYAKDGVYYGIPTHVGAMVMYYNTELLEKAGIDYTKIVTWDDFTAAGKKYRAATGKPLTTVDTGGTDWLSLAMAEYGEDWTNAAGRVNIKIPSVRKMIQMQAQWIRDGVAATSPGGHIDMETGFANLTGGGLAAFPKALWFMSRFVNYMPDMKGKWAIAPCPVFTPGQPRSVGVGGTGTVVSLGSKNAALAAEFMAWAKLSYAGNVKIWQELGFDPCNTDVWTDTKITHDRNNKFIAYFKSNPFDTLNQIKNEIGKIRRTGMSPVIDEQMNINVLVGILQDGADIDSTLNEAQSQIDLEQ